MTDIEPLVIYHHNCLDGFTAAWAIWNVNPDWEFYGGVHGNEPPWDLIESREVYLVDFCYQSAVLEKVIERARRVTILDHHETAQDDAQLMLDHNLASGYFDMGQSGATITWAWFHDEPAPPLLLYIEDRDLWRFSYEGTRAINSALFSYPYNFETWERLMYLDPADLITEGNAIDRKHKKDVEEFLESNVRWMTIAGHRVPAVNLPYFFASDAGHILSERYAPETFAVAYWDTPEGRVFSLRSIEGGLSVADVARQMGGGGHKHAAGFRAEVGWEGEP